MASRAQSVTLSYYAWDTVNAVPKTGDVANHTLRLVKDGGSATAPTNSAAEIDATNLPGWYKVVLTSTETTADVVVLGGKSSSTGIVICGTQISPENLPTAAPGAANGVFIAGTNAATVITTSLTTHFVGTVDTVTTYTGNTPQTGDAYARIGAAGAGLTAVPASGDFTSTMKTSIGTAVAASNVAGVTGNVGGNVVGSVASVTARVTANTDQLAGQTVTAAAGVTFPTSVASPTNITAGTITTTTNLTNLPAITTDWLTGTGVAASAVTKIQAGLSTYAGGAVASVTAAVTLDRTQTLSAARNISAVADTSLTLNDALHCAIAAAAGQETVVSTAYTVKTPSTGTTLRIFALDSATAPTSRT